MLKTRWMKSSRGSMGPRAEGLPDAPRGSRCSTLITPSRTGCATRRGKPSTSMYSRWHTAREKETFYYGDWIRKPGVAICSCNDGLRPVIFKLEATEEPVGNRLYPCRIKGCRVGSVKTGRAAACFSYLLEGGPAGTVCISKRPFRCRTQSFSLPGMRLVVRTAHILPHIEHWCRSLGGTWL